MARTFIHILLGGLLWAVFAWYWRLVMQQTISGETKHALVVVGSIVAGITIFDLFWVLHNLRIARHGRRRNRRPEPAAPTADFLGRTFMAQSDEVLRRAHYVEVHVVNISDQEDAAGHKLFRVSDVVPED